MRVVTEDARTYVRRHRGAFDVIYSLSSNTWAALGSGAFALAENYLFTTEAFQDYWRALCAGRLPVARAPDVHAAAGERGDRTPCAADGRGASPRSTSPSTACRSCAATCCCSRSGRSPTRSASGPTGRWPAGRHDPDAPGLPGAGFAARPAHQPDRHPRLARGGGHRADRPLAVHATTARSSRRWACGATSSAASSAKVSPYADLTGLPDLAAHPRRHPGGRRRARAAARAAALPTQPREAAGRRLALLPADRHGLHGRRGHPDPEVHAVPRRLDLQHRHGPARRCWSPPGWAAGVAARVPARAAFLVIALAGCCSRRSSSRR